VGLTAVALCFALSAAVMGAHALSDFIVLALPQSGSFMGTVGNHSLLAVGWSLGSPALGLIAAGCAFCWAMRTARQRASADETWILAVAASLLCSPLAWSYYFVLTYPALIIRASTLDLTIHTHRGYLVAIVAFLMFWPGLLAGYLASGLLDSMPFFVGLLGPAAGLVMLKNRPRLDGSGITLRLRGGPSHVGTFSPSYPAKYIWGMQPAD